MNADQYGAWAVRTQATNLDTLEGWMRLLQAGPIHPKTIVDTHKG